MELKEARMMTGLSQQKFGDYLHIPLRTIQDWEAGKRSCPEYVKELILYKLKSEKMIQMEV